MRLSVRVLLAALALAFVSSIAKAQDTTNTNCTLYGNTANCTSTTTDNSANNQRAYEAGQQVGNALGVGIARAMEAGKKGRWIKKFCARNPGSSWYWHQGNVVLDRGTCPTNEGERVMAANTFMSKHKDYVPEPSNNKVMLSYLETHNLDPRREKSYERCYNDLKKTGQLHLYSK